MPFRASSPVGKSDIFTMLVSRSMGDRDRLLRDGKESTGRARRLLEWCERTAGAALPTRALWIPRECRSVALGATVCYIFLATFRNDDTPSPSFLFGKCGNRTRENI